MKKRVFLTSIITIAVLVACCLLLIIPGQFATIGRGYSGYEVIFHCSMVDGINYLAKNNPDTRASASGILGLIFILFAFVSSLFSIKLIKKNTALPILSGALTFIAGIMFISMNLSMNIIYKGKAQLGFVTYLIGGLLLFFGALLIVLGIFLVKEEAKSYTASRQYSYIKSNKQK